MHHLRATIAAAQLACTIAFAATTAAFDPAELIHEIEQMRRALFSDVRPANYCDVEVGVVQPSAANAEDSVAVRETIRQLSRCGPPRTYQQQLGTPAAPVQISRIILYGDSVAAYGWSKMGETTRGEVWVFRASRNEALHFREFRISGYSQH